MRKRSLTSGNLEQVKLSADKQLGPAAHNENNVDAQVRRHFSYNTVGAREIVL